MTDASKMDILIVDDDAKNIFALCAVLRSRGFNCVTAQSAIEGINKLKEQPYIGMILMDMMMPDMDGYQAIAKIKEIDSFRHIPIVSVTAQAMEGDREKCLAAGATDYLSKPVNVDELIHVIRRYTNN